jgi:NTP pyrophosphatase (non-canonical NTP hydrolase)
VLNLPPDATLRDLQRYVSEMEHERGFSSNTVLPKCLLLGEEVGELFKAVRRSHAGMRLADTANVGDAREELADILILLCAVANRVGVDLEETFREKEQRTACRVWS